MLAAPASLGSSVFPPVLAVPAGRPIAVHCRVAHSDEVLHRLRDGSAHAGFLLSRPPGDDLRPVRIGRSGIVAVCRPGHPLAERSRLRFGELADSPVLVYCWGVGAESLAAAFEHPDRPVHTIGLPGTASQLAEEDDYVVVVPNFAATRAIERGTVRRLPLSLGEWKVEGRFTHPAASATRPGVAELLDNVGDLRKALALD